MAYAPVKSFDLKQRFPQFSDVDDGLINAVLTESSGQLDGSWPEADWRQGVMLYAAHCLVSEGIGTGNGAMMAGLSRMKDGSVEIETDTVAGEWLNSTIFGMRYLALCRRHTGSIFVV